MRRSIHLLACRSVVFFLFLTLGISSLSGYAGGTAGLPDAALRPDTTLKGDTTLIYPFSDEMTTPGSGSEHPIYLKNPSNLKTEVVYDPVTREYYYTYKIGNMTYRLPSTLSFEEFQNLSTEEMINNYWRERSEAASLDNKTGVIPKLIVPGKFFETIFGNNTVDIRPQGSAEILFGITSDKRDDPSLNVRQRRQTNFDFDENIQMNVIAKIGDKIEFKVNYNTKATFDFENKLKLKYEGKEDEIIQLIEAGDINMPLSSTLIRGTESLFGLKTKLRFGRTTVTAVYSQQKSESKNITVQGNAQKTEFKIKADEYEENKHFFVSQYFRDNYKKALSTLPIISSNINIVKIEVWVTNIGAAVTDNRNIVAFQDLGEYEPYNTKTFHGYPGHSLPDNKSNDLLDVIMPTPADTVTVRNISLVTDYLKSPPFNLVSARDFEKVENARKLLTSEYSFNSRLGFISLNTQLNSDQVLAVAYQYQIVGDPTVYQVGEFSDDGIVAPQCLFLKLLKSTAQNTRIPMWDLMMKNVYPLGAYQVQSSDFMLNILYSGNKNGVPTAYLEETRIKGVPLIQVMNFDNLNTQLNEPSDGLFDFIDNAATSGGTIQASNGRIFFTVLEPFGQDLRDSIYDPNDSKNSLALANKYCYDSLYTMTKTMAKQYADKDKFVLEGYYKSSAGSEISLNALNVPQGSVVVTAGGVKLYENVDYTVDYTLGRVTIINEGILNSGTPINISLESNEMFNVQTKRLIGTHVDYTVNKDFIVGATIMNLNEQPLTKKVSYGDEPISNTVWGVNLSYRTQSRLLTRIIDALPLISTKAESSVAVDGEFAHFIPGHSKAIGKAGTTYIDDFESSKSTIDLRTVGSWFLASTPQGQTSTGMFPEAGIGTGLAYGFNRAKLAWYIIDPLFYDRSSSLVPDNVTNSELSNQYVRQVWESEVFPNKETVNGVPVNQSVLNLAFYPSDRGPYNYDVSPTTYSAGLNADGTLSDPASRWGGIMRRIESTDFESTNIQYIEFWMMDPFVYDSTNRGDLYFNLGDISEDILRDGMKSYENGLPTSEEVINVDTTIWGRVPTLQSLVDAFDDDPASRPYQDVGYDGLRDQDEITFFDKPYMAKLASALGQGSQAYQNASEDPSADDFHYFRGSGYDKGSEYASILLKYKKFNGTENNSPSSANSPESYSTMATTLPNVEDINKDNTLSESESYYQYVVHLDPNKMSVGSNYITDIYEATNIILANGQRGRVKWYQFKIPVRTPDKTVGSIQDFNSIRFMRMFLKNFERPVVCRFATLDLTRVEWRSYDASLLAAGEYIPEEAQNETTFDISTVSIEENGSRDPVPYVIPPGIERETNYGTTNLQKLNEQSMALRVCNLVDGDARAAYKTSDLDFRQFKHLEMFVHAEKSIETQSLKTGDLTLFIRIGSDFTQNYYEYEIPLSFTEWGTSATQADAIWPAANDIDITLERLVEAKYNRILATQESGSTVSASTPYIEYDGNNKITVLGSPSISDVQAIMIGVRNPKKKIDSKDDDGQSKCAEVWVDELRLTGFNKKAGFATMIRATANLADLGRVQLTGTYRSANYSDIEESQTERDMEAQTNLGFDTDLELGKFFPESTGIRIPFHFDYSLEKITPEYDPMNPDLLLTDVVDAMDSKEEQDSIKALAEDLTERINFNLMNVRKDRTKDRKPRIYDIENFNVSYAYSQIFHRDEDVATDMSKTYSGGLGYNFATMPKNVQPFSKVPFLSKSKALQLIKDFNFYYLPRSFTFRTDMNRQYESRQYRNKSQAIVPMETYYIKDWDWTRNYNLNYDFAKSLKFTLNAAAASFIKEPAGKIDKSTRSEIWDEVFRMGTMNNYSQTSSLTWDLPFSKVPILNFINMTAGYQSSYTWTASPTSVQEYLGNYIENGNTRALNGGLNFVNLYNKSAYLKRVNTTPGKKQPDKKEVANRLPERQLKQPKNPADTAKEEKEKVDIGRIMLESTIRVLMSVRKITFQYNQGNGTSLPGFVPEPDLLGLDMSTYAPGLPFVFGSQKDIRYKAATNGWITDDTLLNTAYARKFTENLTINATLEPWKDLRIELTATKQQSRNNQEYFKANSSGVFPTPEDNAISPTMNGSFTISCIALRTIFTGSNDDNTSDIFEKMKAMRTEVAQRYAAQNPWSQGTDSLGYPQGYGPTSQEVLLTSFLAAYKGQDPGKIKLTAFPSIPLPNWRITYDGLTKIKALKKLFRTFTLTHGYVCTYSVGSYSRNIRYEEENGCPVATDDAGNFIPKEDIQLVTLNEQFNPLIRFEMTWVNSFTSNLEVKKSRNLGFSFANNQLTEVTTNEYVAGIGYRFKNIRINFSGLSGSGKSSKSQSDLNVRLDFSLRQNKTVLRRADQDINQISTGQQIVSIDFSADYDLSKQFNIRFYFEKDINSPYVSNQYRTSNTKGGFALRFNLAQ
ncbi:MAG TPA: cell surface protein SprA [Bacteroidales bacterium]|nr:cell surface protein SprA [Bacteroidales bacterium]